MDISKDIELRIVGIGRVGASIVQAFAQSGFTVYGIDIDQTNIDNGLKRIEQDLGNLVLKEKMNSTEKEVVLSRIKLGTELESIRNADVIIEAIYEDMDAKKDMFNTIDTLVTSREALLLTNTSSLSVSEIASATNRPEQVAGMHFFNPVPVMKLVEVVRGVLTSDSTIDRIKDLALLMGKTPIISADRPGFIVNRMLNALFVEAARIVEEGVGTIEDVDIGAKLGCGHPMGPFELFDYLDALPLLEHITDYMAEELGERFRLPAWVKKLVEEGKAGKGIKKFYG
ncbi:MAG: 3-hydroxyacyl-CoA dehydrogenase family protein [Deltaproteobacteria bacterium]|nr:3-hydroxyacyl-CoA dehydrogenase family protein [Deltaproteobacteria bacterium]